MPGTRKRAGQYRWWISRSIAHVGMALTALLGTLAINFSTLEPAPIREGLTLAFAAMTFAAVIFLRWRWALLVWGVPVAVCATWFMLDPPQENRDWAPEYAVRATTSRVGDTVTFHNIRDFVHHSEAEATPAYYDASFRLGQLSSIDLIVSYWAGDWIAHTFVSFGFSDGRYLAMSIETRRQRHVQFSAIAGFFRHYELFYVVADERDLIGVRTDIRRERVYLYRVRTTREARSALFLSYVDEIEQLNRQPRWYNTLVDNCTTGILARAVSSGAMLSFDWRILLSGFVPQYAYDLGILNPDLPFDELRARSRIVRPPGVAISPRFSEEIRQGVPL